MRLCILMVCVALVTICSAEPEPKKYKSQVKDKDKTSNTTLSADEKKFLRDVEEKYGIRNDKRKEEKKPNSQEKIKKPLIGRPPFPAVIAIEIVNDTDSKGKGKRTIDANLGYGYKTNNGYTYNYFGKPSEDKGKFMIYPYSQEDISAPTSVSYQDVQHYENGGKQVKTSVEITPSQAFELVEEKPSYHYNKPSVEFKTPSSQSYSSSGSHGSSYSPRPNTLYTTYNGEQFSGLSGQFPSVMSNYLVDPSQLIKNPEYQNVGLTQDHLRLQGNHLEQKVVPVLVLRIPSSSLTNPTAELYADLPNNYPLSNYLNNINLQELVNQYFKKNGYKFAPQVMAFSNSAQGPLSQGQPQHYSHPYVQPSYTQSHYSGVQYSSVQPVMARYPSSYHRHHYMSMPKGQSLYKHYSMPAKYDYPNRYVSKTAQSAQKFYSPSSHYYQQTEHVAPQYQGTPSSQSSGGHERPTEVKYEAPAQVSIGYESAVTPSAEYGTPQAQSYVQYDTQSTAPQYGVPSDQSSVPQYGVPSDHSSVSQYGAPSAHSSVPQYGVPSEQSAESIIAGYDSTRTSAEYGAPSASGAVQDYYSQQQDNSQQGLTSGYSSQIGQSEVSYQTDHQTEDGSQSYVYQTNAQQGHEPSQSGLVLSENYPSKDHTIATVLPSQYNQGFKANSAVQTVSYVTPTPYSSKYQMPFKIMVPQTFLQNPTTEKVEYVNSQSYSQPESNQEYNPEEEYTTGYHYVPPVSKPKASSYPRNYHTYPKRMAKPDKSESQSSTYARSKSDRNEKSSSSSATSSESS